MQTVEYEAEVVCSSRPLVRWGPVFAGAITAIAVTTLGMALWMATPPCGPARNTRPAMKRGRST